MRHSNIASLTTNRQFLHQDLFQDIRHCDRRSAPDERGEIPIFIQALCKGWYTSVYNSNPCPVVSAPPGAPKRRPSPLPVWLLLHKGVVCLPARFARRRASTRANRAWTVLHLTFQFDLLHHQHPPQLSVRQVIA